METMNFGEEQNNSAPKAPNNRKKKLIWAGIIVAVLILSVIGWQYWQYTHSMYYRQMQGIKYLEKITKESDKWGGKTPEETVILFRDAIKKGDFELASKYGPSEDLLKLKDPLVKSSDNIKSALEKIKNDKNINLLINDLENGVLEEAPGFGGRYVDLVIKENGKRKYSVLTVGKSDGGTWKIVEF